MPRLGWSRAELALVVQRKQYLHYFSCQPRQQTVQGCTQENTTDEGPLVLPPLTALTLQQPIANVNEGTVTQLSSAARVARPHLPSNPFPPVDVSVPVAVRSSGAASAAARQRQHRAYHRAQAGGRLGVRQWLYGGSNEEQGNETSEHLTRTLSGTLLACKPPAKPGFSPELTTGLH